MEVGKVTGDGYEIRFKRDANGKIDTKEGKLNPASSHLKIKHREWAQLCLGVAKCECPSGEIEGKQADPFDYSARVLLLVKDHWYEKAPQEIKKS